MKDDLDKQARTSLPFPAAPRIRSLARRERGIGLTILNRVESERPNDPLGQIGLFFEIFDLPAGTGRQRISSVKTRAAYLSRMNAFIKKMKKMNMPVRNLHELNSHRIRLVFQQLEREHASASWLANLNTTVRRFCFWIDKVAACPPIWQLLANPERARRSYSAVIPKNWSAHGVSEDKTIGIVSGLCRVTGLQLRLMRDFGLRVQESICLRVVEANVGGRHLIVFDGTKGGRPRVLSIETAEQRDLLQEIANFVNGNPNGNLMYDPTHSLAQARRRFYYVLQKAGITKNESGVTAYGLRHGHLCDVYFRVAGEKAPVLGGAVVPDDLRKAAVHVVKKQAGHGRDSIAAAYIGNHKTLSRMAVTKLSSILKLVVGDHVVTDLARDSGIVYFGLTGPMALGRPVEDFQVVCFSFSAMPVSGEDQICSDEKLLPKAQRIAARIGQLLGVSTSIMSNSLVGAAVPQFELTPFGKNG